jgi:drug/metabolite transporter (DMT)-like permease
VNPVVRISHSISGKGLVAVVAWGASFSVVRYALQFFNPFSLVTVRFGLGALLLFVILRVRGMRLLPAPNDLGMCSLLGCVLGGHLLIQSFGLQYTSAINTGWIIGFIPIMLAVGAHVVGRQRMGGIGWLGVLAGAGGVVLVTMSSLPNFRDSRLGDLLQFTSCLTWTIYTLVGAGPVERNGAMRVSAYVMGVAAVITLVPTISVGAFRQIPTLGAVVAVGFLGFICSGLVYYLWFQAVMEHGPARVGSLIYLEPFISLAVATMTLREVVTVNAAGGGLCVLIGVWLIARGTKAPPAPVEPGDAATKQRNDQTTE